MTEESGHWVGPEFECGRDCVEGEPGAWTWHTRICQLWQDVNEQGEPEGPPYEKFKRHVDTGEPCMPPS
jgi:hypothetical protein